MRAAGHYLHFYLYVWPRRGLDAAEMSFSGNGRGASCNFVNFALGRHGGEGGGVRDGGDDEEGEVLEVISYYGGKFGDCLGID